MNNCVFVSHSYADLNVLRNLARPPGGELSLIQGTIYRIHHVFQSIYLFLPGKLDYERNVDVAQSLTVFLVCFKLTGREENRRVGGEYSLLCWHRISVSFHHFQFTF